ncbi:MAG: isoleucine--tRNA ligase [Dehalococcoidales bacterium]|nr:isoleucine--tRNA ligase [Dehalococcoidales bacterium]
MFNPVNSRVNFPQTEEKLLEFWKQNHIFEKSVQNREGKPRFVLYEGPPTANGNPGIHHVLARAYKDIITRYKVMKGYYAPRIAGWDTHGLPVELEVEKELGFSGKAQIEAYGVEQFNAKCRASVFKYLKEWDMLTERIAYWVDLEHAYITMNNSYIESVWWAIKQMWDKGLIYQGYKVTPHCPRCGTSLSSHEVALGYQDDTADPSVYIKFRTHLKSNQDSPALSKIRKLSQEKKTYLLAWTTTPWTLPGNTAVAVALDAEYAVVEVDDEYLIFADALRKQAGLGENPVIEKLKGRELVGVEYEPLFNPHSFGVERRRFESATELKTQKPDAKLVYHVIAADFVSMEDGTGIVHIAPAYGEADYQAGQENGLDFVHNVDLQGKIIGSYPFAGKFIKAADPLVLEDLKRRGLLFKSGTVRHTYPFCWRCNAPLVYYAKQSWYIKTTAVKEALINGNKEINWYPEHIKSGRFGNWLENNVDWAFSRERYWGTPLPVWKCEKCGAFECVGSVDEIKSKPGFNGLKEPLDLHRPFVDDATFACTSCGGQMKRAPEVIDCWFDSGSMPFAQAHYPFENKDEFDKVMKQADYICEGVDQTRGWFYSLHAISTLLFDRPCYKNCICLELVLDAKGEKMSKSKGNVVKPMEVVKLHGADALRWYCYTSAPPGSVHRFDTKMVADITRQFLLTLWNVYSFFVMYANIDNYKPGTQKTTSELPELDRWILSELNQLILDVDSALENYNPTGAGRKIEEFVDMLSNWYVRRSRRRFWKSESDTDKLSAYNTLYQCLVTVAKLLAPFTPYIAEEIYQNMVRAVDKDAPVSVHLTDFPVADESRINRDLSADTQLAMKVCSLGRAARSQASIKVRQPLAQAIVKVASQREREGLKRLTPQILEELNVKALAFADNTEELNASEFCMGSEGEVTVAIPKDVPPELLKEGLAREIVHRLQTMRKTAGFEITDYITTYYQGDDYLRQVMTDFADYLKQETLSRSLTDSQPEEGAYTENFKLSGHLLLLGVKRV